MKNYSMMWRVLSLVVALFAALTLTFAPVLAPEFNVAPVFAEDDDDDDDDDGETLFLGRKVAGSYLGMVELSPGSAPLPSLFTFHRERTATFSSPNGNASLAHGTWIPTGYNTIEGTFVELLYTTEGFLVQIAVFTFAQEFMNHFKTFEANGDVTIFACPPDSMGNPVCPDPFDPNTPPIFGGPFTVTAQRIKAVQN